MLDVDLCLLSFFVVTSDGLDGFFWMGFLLSGSSHIETGGKNKGR